MTDDEKQKKEAAETANEKSDEVTDESAEARETLDEHAVMIVEPSEVTKGSASGILQEALVQLKKLSALREQELERQERLINQMQDVVGRHSRTNKTLLGICLITLVLVGVLSYALIKLGFDQTNATDGLNDVATKVDKAAESMRQQSEEEIRKINELQSGVSTRLNKSVNQMRRERDEVTAAVQTAINRHNVDMRNREVNLREEEERIAEDAEMARQDRLRIIGEAIERLSTMASELEADDGKAEDAMSGAEASGDSANVPEALLAEEN